MDGNVYPPTGLEGGQGPAKRSRSVLALLAAAAVPVVAWVGRSATRLGYETAQYEVLQREGPVEVRRYAEQTLAETPMTRDPRGRRSFGRLFDYITGANARSEKIAMTTPVFTEEPADGVAGSMAFVVPREVAGVGAPEASSRQVALRKLAPHTVVSLRFDGGREASTMAEAEKQLRAWMARHALEPAGGPRFAFYDPPWTPRFLRRNEVQIPLAS